MYFNYNKTSVFVFMVVYLCIINIGFYIGSKGKIIEVVNSKNKFQYIYSILSYSLFIAVFLQIVNFAFLVSEGKISLDLSSLGSNYVSYYENYNEKKDVESFSRDFNFLLISSVPKFISLCLGLFYFKILKRKEKIKLILLIMLILLNDTIAKGNQKSIGDIVIFGLLAFVVNVDFEKYKKKLYYVSLLTGILLLFFMGYSQYSRYTSRDLDIKDINQNVYEYASFDLEHPMFKVFGDKIGFGISFFVTSYLSDGYYGLSKCLELDFEWTYGFGNSLALQATYDKVTGENIYNQTYLGRMEKEYNIQGKAQWHTIFPWLASDITFVGALLIFFPISYIYGKSWKEAIIYKNPVSYIMVCLLTVMFVFVPANNQILSGIDYFVITNVLFLFWLFNHKKYNFKY